MLKSLATPDFWKLYHNKENQWSARVGDHYRAVGRFVDGNTFLWAWIGSHEDYNKL